TLVPSAPRPRHPRVWPPGPLATTATAPAATAATAAPESCATMASLRVLAFDQEGRSVAFDTWHNDLQLYLLSDSKDIVSLFDHVSGAAPAPPATADGLTRSQWLSRDTTPRLAIRNHLPVTECAHFGEHRTAQALYDAIVSRYSSPTTAALGKLLLPYVLPELSAFATVADLVTHLRSSVARYRAALPTEFLAGNLPPMYITLYFVVTHLPESLRSVRDHFLTLDPTSLTIDLLEQHLLAAETSAVAVGAARGTPRSPFFEGCSPSPLSPSFVSAAAAADVSTTEDVSGGGGGGGSGRGGGGSGRGGGGSGGGGGGGTGGDSGGFGGGGGGSGWSGGSGGGGTGGGRSGPRPGGPGGGRGQQQQRRSETQSPQQLREWSGVAIFDLDYDASLSAMYALSFSAEGDCYRCVPPDPGIAAAALGASASGTPPGTAPAEALHTFTLDSDALRGFFRDSTTLTPLPALVPVKLADPSRGPVVARSSTVLPCPAVPSGSLSGLHLPSFSTNLVSTAALQDAMITTTTLGGQRVSICTCTRMGRHLAAFTRQLGSSLYTLATEPPEVTAYAQVSASGQVAASCSCRLLSHQTLLWHHRLGHPSLPRLRGMHSRLLVSGLPRSLPPLPPSPAPPCLPCVEGRQCTAPHSSSFPPTIAPQQTLHMDFSKGAEPGGAGSEGAGFAGAEPEGVEPGVTESEGAESGGAEPRGAALSRGPACASPRLSSQQLREWLVRRAHRRSGAPAAGGAVDAEAGGAAVTTGAGGTGGIAATGPGGARTSGAGAGSVGCAGAGDPTEPGAAGAGGAGGAGAGVAGVGGPGARGAVAAGARVGGTNAGGTGATGAGAVDPGAGGARDTPTSPLPAPSPYSEQSGGLTEHREPVSRPVLPVRTARGAPHSRPPPVPSTHTMALCPSSDAVRVPLPSPPESSLPDVPVLE
ncbi:unnamed protein product, partial [Closterium sp. NIES-54]